MITLKINAVQFRFIKLLDHLLLPLQAQLTFLYLLRVIMPKLTGKPRGKPRKLSHKSVRWSAVPVAPM